MDREFAVVMVRALMIIVAYLRQRYRIEARDLVVAYPKCGEPVVIQ